MYFFFFDDQTFSPMIGRHSRVRAHGKVQPSNTLHITHLLCTDFFAVPNIHSEVTVVVEKEDGEAKADQDSKAKTVCLPLHLRVHSDSRVEQEEKMRVPSQPSPYVASFLFSVCQEINRIGAHNIDKVLSVFSQYLDLLSYSCHFTCTIK